MKNWRIGLLALAAALPLASPAFAEKAAVGKLECDVSSGIGMFVVEKQKMNCKFTSIDSATVDYYTGQIAEYGVAIGEIQKGVLLWGVISATDTVPGPAALAGEYGGAGADVRLCRRSRRQCPRRRFGESRSPCSRSRSKARRASTSPPASPP